MPVTVVDHPLAQHYLTVLRDRRTTSADFRHAARRLAYLLVAKATEDLGTVEREIETPLESMAGSALAKRTVVVAVLRAGLGLLDAAVELLPDASIGYAGVQRDEETAEPLEYYTRFPPMSDARVLVLEPMLATGGSLEWAVGKVKQHGAVDIASVCVVAAPVGIERMQRSHPDVHVVTASVDRELDHHFYIRPGLGDMGDRLFGTA